MKIMSKYYKSLIYGTSTCILYNRMIKTYSISFPKYLIILHVHNNEQYGNKQLINICDAFYIDHIKPKGVYTSGPQVRDVTIIHI